MLWRTLASGLPPMLAQHYSRMSSRGKIMVEYICLGGSGDDLRSKTRVLDCKPASVDELQIVKFDGFLTDQAFGETPVVYAKPRVMVPDPFRGGDHLLVLCETFHPHEGDTRGSQEMRPHPTNNRAPCATVMRLAAGSEPFFSIEQQYTLLDSTNNWPLGWPERATQGALPSSYCSVGNGATFGREFSERHFRACIHAGIPISGYNSEEVRGQWSYKVGPCRGLEIGDHLWLSRYILLRCSEQCNVKATYDAKPVPGDWNGNGAFVKYSTASTRSGRGTYQGYMEIQRHIQLLEAVHLKHMMVYGSGNSVRMSPVAMSPLTFSWAVGSKSTSLRISDSWGHYEDRRPAANMDPYLVTMMLVCTTLGIAFPDAHNHYQEALECTCSSSSRGSSAILSELDKQDTFAPETPPQNISLLDSECSSC